MEMIKKVGRNQARFHGSLESDVLDRLMMPFWHLARSQLAKNAIHATSHHLTLLTLDPHMSTHATSALPCCCLMLTLLDPNYKLAVEDLKEPEPIRAAFLLSHLPHRPHIMAYGFRR